MMGECKTSAKLVSNASRLKLNDVRLKAMHIGSKLCTLRDHAITGDAIH